MEHIKTTRTRGTIDWKAIEPDGRAGVNWKRQMAQEHGVLRTALDKHFDNAGI